MRIAIRHRPESAATVAGTGAAAPPAARETPGAPPGVFFLLLRHVDSDAATIEGLWDQLRGSQRRDKTAPACQKMKLAEVKSAAVRDWPESVSIRMESAPISIRAP